MKMKFWRVETEDDNFEIVLAYSEADAILIAEEMGHDALYCEETTE